MALDDIEKTDAATLYFLCDKHLLIVTAEEEAHEFARNLEITDGGIERDREGIVPDVAEEFFHGVIVEALILLGLCQDTVRSGELRACVLES